MTIDANEMQYDSQDDTHGDTQGMRSPLDSVKHVVSNAAARLSDAAPTTDDVRAGARRLSGLIRENPVSFALGSVAVGFLMGLILPRTSVEADRLEDVKRMAKNAGSQAVEAGKQMVLDTVATTFNAKRSTDARGSK